MWFCNQQIEIMGVEVPISQENIEEALEAFKDYLQWLASTEGNND